MARVADERGPGVDTAAQFLGREAPPRHRPNAERRVEPLGLQHDADAFGGVAAGQCHVLPAHRDDVGEHVGGAAPEGEDCGAGHVVGMHRPVRRGHHLAKANQACFIGKRERPPHDMVHCAEHRGVGADAEAEDRRGDQRVPERAAQEAEGEPEVLEEGGEHAAPLANVLPCGRLQFARNQRHRARNDDRLRTTRSRIRTPSYWFSPSVQGVMVVIRVAGRA